MLGSACSLSLLTAKAAPGLGDPDSESPDSVADSHWEEPGDPATVAGPMSEKESEGAVEDDGVCRAGR